MIYVIYLQFSGHFPLIFIAHLFHFFIHLYFFFRFEKTNDRQYFNSTEVNYHFPKSKFHHSFNSFSFILDTRPPQITFSGNLPETTSRNPTLTWSSSEFATFECQLEDGVVFECGSGNEGLWTGNNLRDGLHSLSVRGTDKLGNKGQFISRSWSVGKCTVITE